MGRICLLCGQKATTDKPLFRFPGNDSKRVAWAQACGLNPKHVKVSQALCIKHFRDEDINVIPQNQTGIDESNVQNRLRLKKVAIPTLFLNNVQSCYSHRLKTCFLCQTKDSSCSYFQFPKDPQQRRAWLQYCGITIPNEISEDIEFDCTKYLCSKHFSEDDVLGKCMGKGKTRLRKNAIPIMHIVTSQNLPDPELQVVERECLTIVRRNDHDNVRSIPNLLPKPEPHANENILPNSSTSDVDRDPLSPDGTLEPELILVECETIRNDDIDNIIMNDSDSDPDFEIPLPLDANHAINEQNETLAKLLRLNHSQCSTCQQFITHLHTHSNVESSPNTRSNISAVPKTHPDFDTPEKARRSFDLAKNEVVKCRKKIDIMSKKLKRRDAKLDSYEKLITQLRNKDASPALLVSKHNL